MTPKQACDKLYRAFTEDVLSRAPGSFTEQEFSHHVVNLPDYLGVVRLASRNFAIARQGQDAERASDALERLYDATVNMVRCALYVMASMPDLKFIEAPPSRPEVN